MVLPCFPGIRGSHLEYTNFEKEPEGVETGTTHLES